MRILELPTSPRELMPCEDAVGDKTIEKEWDRFNSMESPNILNKNGLCIAEDGGLSDIDELMNPMKYFTAGLMFMSSLVNTYILAKSDLTAVFVAADPIMVKSEREFLVSKWILQSFDPNSVHASGMDKLVPLLEFGFLVFVIARIAIYGCLALLAPRLKYIYGETGEFWRWSYISEIFWNYLQQLSSFSAMRLLYYVTPTVAGTQGYVVAWLVKHELAESSTTMQRLRAVWPMVSYLCSLLVFLVIGLDAFLVKYRMASDFIDQGRFDATSLLHTFIFVFQVLGVVNLNCFVKERLFIFIFGGEDGNVEPEEKMRWDLWNALLTKNIYRQFGVLRGTVVMMGFDDYDFQSLVLDDHGKGSKLAAKAMQRSSSTLGLRMAQTSSLPLVDTTNVRQWKYTPIGVKDFHCDALA
mmetsp:Transcript_120428/g.269220  ORF Transcript_120428/g.269220 Transcript_120428/m.269220 type:complete len:412 (-) Transcript_120428:423-1658(-)